MANTDSVLNQQRDCGYTIAKPARWTIMIVSFIALSVRLESALREAGLNRLDPLNAYGFGVIFPLVLVLLILSMGPGRTREGVLMRLGTAMQLLLIALIPVYALQLLLGLPVVFLIVEIFETRLSKPLRDRIAGRMVNS